MSHTLYATFAQPEAAERAAGALLDKGVRAEDLSVVRQGGDTKAIASNVAASPGSIYGVEPTPEGDTEERIDRANGDAPAPEAKPNAEGEMASGAIKGSLVGAGLGAVAVIAALVVPGVGVVLGLGALASALGGIVATAGVGAAAGAIVGHLKEMGVDEEVAREYGQAVESGGAVLAVTVPSGAVSEEDANAILSGHGASNVNRYAAREHVA